MSDNTDNIDRAVSRALEQEPEFELPNGFADRVMAMIELKAAAKEAKRDRWWLVLGITSMIGALVYAFQAVDFSPKVGVFTFVSGYSGLIIFGILFVVALHLIDKLILKPHK